MQFEITHPSEGDLQWCAGVLDVHGSLEIASKDSPNLMLAFWTPYRDRLVEFQKAIGGLGRLTGPYPPGGNSVQPQYQLAFRGSALAFLENLLWPRLRTEKLETLKAKHEEASLLRQRLGLRSSTITQD